MGRSSRAKGKVLGMRERKRAVRLKELCEEGAWISFINRRIFTAQRSARLEQALRKCLLVIK